MKKSKRSEISLIQDKIWELCKQIIRYRDGTTCITCGAKDLAGSNRQTGHFIPDSVSGAYLRYDLRNLGLQCGVCNLRRGGYGAEFYRRRVAEMGQEWVDTLFADKNNLVKALDHYKRIHCLYQKIVDNFPADRKVLLKTCAELEVDFNSQSE